MSAACKISAVVAADGGRGDRGGAHCSRPGSGRPSFAAAYRLRMEAALAMSMRHFVVDKALSDRCAAVEPCHLRRYCSLVDENETGGIELLSLQCLSRGRDIRPILLGRVEDFF